MKFSKIMLLTALILFVFGSSCQQTPGNIPSPESFFGFDIGTDGKLAHPDEMIAYFKELDRLSGRLIFMEVGRTTDDNPFVMAIISSEDNISNIERYRQINAQLADPRTVTDEQAQELIREGKTIVNVNASIHATEVGPAQASNVTAYKLVTGTTPEIQQILDNVILVLTPMHNPDGANMVVDWWRKYAGTEYEGSSLPYLYQRYTGHDNNRDWYFFTQKETQLTIKHVYEEWHPQIVLDMHQMGSGGARLFVPPFVDPYEDNIDPILQVNVNMLGTYMMNRLIAQGFSGIESHRGYDAWTPGRAFQHYHGAVRILTETASVNIAAPIEVRRENLEQRGYLSRSVFFPKPWEGGAWTLKDIVDINVAAIFSILENAALTRTTWLSNFYQVGKNAVSEKTDPFAIVIPPEQRDKFSAQWLIDVLQTGMVEVHKAEESFSADGRQFSAGSAVVFMNQPYYSFAKTLLEKQVYPEFRQYPGGPIQRPYDLVAHTLPLLMDVDVVFIDREFEAQTTLMKSAEVPVPSIAEGDAPYGFIMPHASNGTFIAANRLLAEGFPVYWTSENFVDGNSEYPAGTVIAFNKEGGGNRIRDLAREYRIDLHIRQTSTPVNGYRLNPVKLGLYKSWSGNSSEGWTRWVMEQFGFDLESAHNDMIKAGNLNEKYTSILLASYSEDQLLNGRSGNTPPEYRGGIGNEGVNNLKDFVRRGGTLITYGSSNDFAINAFNLGITNVLNTLSREQRQEISIPGSLLRTVNDINNPIAYGLKEESAVFYRNGSFYNVRQGKIISRYPNTDDLLLSGWLEGGDYLKGNANVVEVPYGQGRIVIFGFDPIYRAQAQSTFKYIFNAMFYGAAEQVTIPGSVN
ncbi:M14 family metallopeptidase [candidate division KSB1 bacterium]